MRHRPCCMASRDVGVFLPPLPDDDGVLVSCEPVPVIFRKNTDSVPDPHTLCESMKRNSVNHKK